MSGKRIIVTGGTGFVGSNLINVLCKKNTCYNLGRSSSSLCSNIPWDLQSKINDNIMPSAINTVIHCASIVGLQDIEKKEYININLVSTLELLEYCIRKGINKFIYISTGGVYGFRDNPFSENENCNPDGVYSLTKYFSELFCNHYRNKMEIIVLRLFFPYGIGQQGRLIPKLINRIKKNEKIYLSLGGKPFINPIYIDDLCSICSLVVDTGLLGVYNVCGDETVSIRDICNIIAKKLNIKDVLYVDSNNNIGNLLGTNKKICKALNYKIQIKLEDGLEKIINQSRLG